MTVFKSLAVALAACFVGASFVVSCEAETKSKSFVYFGTYSGQKSKGIYVSRFDSVSGEMSVPELAVEATNASFLAVSPSVSTNGTRFLYAVSEVDAGKVTAYIIDNKTGRLTLLNAQSSHGKDPCHLSVDKSGKWVFVANYGSGSVAVLPVKPDGSLAEATNVIQNAGSSVNKSRQEGPHAHWVGMAPQSSFLFCCDLGLDKLVAAKFDSTNGVLLKNLPVFTSLKPGAGPRHMVFSPDDRFAYVINELDSTVSVFSFTPGSGKMTAVQTVRTLPSGFTGVNYPAEVEVHPTGRFLFCSNRGHNTLAMYQIDKQTGKLRPMGFVPTEGKTPRHFAIDPLGNWTVVANQDSDSVVIFRIDERLENLMFMEKVDVGSPVCIKFVPMP